MSKFRSECKTSYSGTALPDDTAIFLIRNAVMRRKALIYGQLHGGQGKHCALGCFWADNPNATLNTSLVDEVAAVNDSVPPQATQKERWKKVNGWLRWKIKVLSAQA